MAGVQKKRKPKQLHLQKRQGKRSYKEDQEIAQLEQIVQEGAPARGSNPLAAPEPEQGGASTSYAGARTFEDLPISQYTKDGLSKAKYVTLTAIQRAAVPHALCGRDILGAAKTGSGKTLAFLIPVVEKLYRLKWTRLDGLGALVLTPTRELAVQIFEELKKVGTFHDLSAGLLIGGKGVKEEAGLVARMNILVCTPGRLLQHMDETPGFDVSALQILVLDEADRILDMGFAATMDAIVANLPRERQTMLFSATQTKSVRDLARLSLASPEYLAVHAEAAAPTPLKLQQAYMVVDAGQKMDVLWSFVKTHLKAKTIIFLSTCKQVRFVFEAFRKLRPGVPLRCLHGGLKQGRRTGVFYEFCEAQAMVLIATDIAARGLDFPTVDWVVQADCPEDAATYIHRVGRTARYTASGRALLLLLPSERQGMLAALEAAKVPLTQIRANPVKQQAVSPALQALLSKDVELKEFAQKALVAYLRSVFLQPAKAVFDVAAIPAAEMAASWGLVSVPKLRFLRKVRGKQQVVEVGGKEALEEEEEEEEERNEEDKGRMDAGGSDSGSEDADADAVRRQGAGEASGSGRAAAAGGAEAAAGGKKRRLAAREGGAGKGAAGGSGASGKEQSDEEEDDFLVVKKRDVFAGGEDAAPAAAPADDDGEPGDEAGGARKKKKKKQKIRVGMASGNRMVFDEQGNALDPLEQLAAEQLGSGGEEEGVREGEGSEGLYVVGAGAEERFKRAAHLMRGRDREDRARLKQLRKDMKLEWKARQRAAAEGDEVGPAVAVLGRGGDGSGSEEEEDGGYSEEEEERAGRGGSGSSGEEDEEVGRAPSAGRRAGAGAGREVAHMGMALRRDVDGEAEAGRGPGTRARTAAALPASLAEQEALALRLLGARR